jgi:hypothetical protein
MVQNRDRNSARAQLATTALWITALIAARR